MVAALLGVLKVIIVVLELVRSIGGVVIVGSTHGDTRESLYS